MKQKDTLDQLFERLEGTFDIETTPVNHEKRFLAKLEATETTHTVSRTWWKPLSIAASVVLLICAGLFLQNKEEESTGLASVSPELEKTQSFFTSVINEELQTLKSFENQENRAIIKDAIGRLEALEVEYDSLKIDLVESGNDKRVIAAMIANFQNRIQLLEQVIENIEEIKTLKANSNEDII